MAVVRGGIGRRASVGFGVAVLLSVAALFPASASAWEIAKSTNGVILQRSDDDTQTVNVTVYTDPKPGLAWSSYSYASGYNTVSTQYTFDAQTRSVEFPIDGSGWTMVSTKYGTVQDEKHVFYLDALRVSVVGTPTVEVSAQPPVVVSDMPSITIDAVSVDATAGLQVDPWTATGFDPEDIGVGFAWFCIFSALVFGSMAVVAGWPRD